MKNRITKQLLTFFLAFSMVLTGLIPGVSNSAAIAEEIQEVENLEQEIDAAVEEDDIKNKELEGLEQDLQDEQDLEDKIDEESDTKELEKETEELEQQNEEETEIKEELEQQSEEQLENPEEIEECEELDDDIIPGEVIVKFRDDVVSGCSISRVKDGSEDTGLYLLNTDKSINKTIQELEENPDIEFAEPNRKYYIFDDVNKDKYIDEQWALDDLGAHKTWAELGNLSGEATVAVVDSGVDYNHPDLQGKLLSEGKNFAAKDGFGGDYPSNRDALDDEGHGTFVAGVIAAKKDNEIGISGVAGDLDVKILPVKVMNNRGYGSTFDISKGIKHAADQDVDIINLSLGGKGYSNIMAEAVRYAQDKGVLVVAASGNEGDDASRYYPASLPGVLTVGAIDRQGNIANFSNFGNCVDVYAPGVNIISTTIKGNGTMGGEDEGYYSKANGTSFAAPYVSGIAAAYKIKNPNASAGEIIEVIKKSADEARDKTKNMNILKGNMYNAIVSDAQYENYVRLLLPRIDSYVSDEAELKAQLIKDINEIDKVVFYYDEIKDENKIIEIENNSNKEIYEYKWDTTKIDCGKHKIIVAAYIGDELKDKDSTSIYVINEVKTGLVLKVKDPSGKLAINSQVHLYSKEADDNEEESYEELWTGLTDNQGLVRIPNTILDDMTEYQVLVNGVFDFEDSPEGKTLYIYNRKVEGPGTIEIDGNETIAVKFNTKDKEGKALSDVKYYATVTDENGIKIGTTSSLNDEAYNSPTIYMDEGKYDLFAYSKTKEETYFLNQLAKVINKNVSEVVFDGAKTGKVVLDTKDVNDPVNSYIYLYNEYTKASMGISADEHISGENILVSSGEYNYTIELEVKDPKGEKNWIYVFDSLGDKVKISEGKDNIISVGGEVKLHTYEIDKKLIKRYCNQIDTDYNEEDIIYSEENGIKTYKVPRSYTFVYTKHEIKDEHDNNVIAIFRGSLGQENTSEYDSIKNEGLEEIKPEYKATNIDNGDVAYTGEYMDFYQYGFWYIANPDHSIGKYYVDLTIKNNPLSNGEIKGRMINNIYDKQVKTIKLKDKKGNTLVPYTWIYRLEEDENGSSHWEKSYGLWCNRWGNNIGSIVLDSGVKLSNKKNGNIAVFHFLNEETKNEVFVFRKFTNLDELGNEIIIDTDKLQLVKLNPVDKDGKALDCLYRSQNIIIDKGLEVPYAHNLDMFYYDGVYLEPGVYGFNGTYMTPKDEDGEYNAYYLIENNVEIAEDGKNNEVKLDGTNTANINVNVEKGDYDNLRGIGLLPFNKYQSHISKHQIQGNKFYITAGIKYDAVKLAYVLSDPEDPGYIWNYFIDKNEWTGKTFEKGEQYELKYGVRFKPSIKLKRSCFGSNSSIKGKSYISDEYGNKITKAEVTICPNWLMDSKDRSNDYSYFYRYLPNGNVTMEVQALDDEEYTVNHGHHCPFDIRDVNPHLKIYKIEGNKEELLFNETKEEYFDLFNEKIGNMEEGQYRAELSFSAGPNGIVKTGSSEGLFTIGKAEPLILDWYQDGNYSHRQDGKNASVEQFFTIFNKPVKDVKFKIIIPDKTKEDPYGKGAYKVIDKNTNNEKLPKKGEPSLFVSDDPCHEDNFRNGFSSKYTIELTEDWTEILNTKETGLNYFDERFNPIRLVAEDFIIEDEEMEVDAVSSATHKPQKPQPDKEDKSDSVVARRDINLVKDSDKPRIVYQNQVSKQKGDDYEIPGTYGFVTNEPVQINAPYYEDHHGFNPITPAQGEEAPLFKAKYIMIKDSDGKPVEGIEVEGKYDGSTCLWKDTLTKEKEVDGPFEFDVYPFDEDNRIKCVRDFGWYYITPEKELQAGEWKLVIDGIADDAGNLMDKYEVKMQILSEPYFTVDKITKEGVTVTYTNPIEITDEYMLVIQEPNGDGYKLHVVSAKLEKGTKTATFKFEEPLEKVTVGTWTVNLVEYIVKENKPKEDKTAKDDNSSSGSGSGSSGRSGGIVTKPNEPAKKVEEKVKEEKAKINAKQNSVNLLNDEVKIEVGREAIDKEITVKAKIIEEKNISIPKDEHNLAGKVYEIETETLENPMKLTLKYDRAKVKDVRKLGVYKYNEKTNEWDYMGGKINVKEDSVTTETQDSSKYTVMEYDKTFKDIKEHWAKEDIELMAARYIVVGTEKDEFKPNTKITRKEFATMLARVLRIDNEETQENKFADIPNDAWYASYVNAAYKAGLVKGTEEGKFEPDKEITREEMITMLMRCYNKLTNSDYNELMATTNQRFKDEETISEWAYQATIIGNSLGIIKGKTGNVFAPKDNATKAEAATMLKRLLESTNNF